MSEPLYLAVTTKLNFSPCNGCRKCSLRCSSDVPFAPTEWAAVSRHIETLSGDELEALRRVEHQDKTVDLGDGVTVAMCRYFDMETESCMIYSVRPLMCRLMGHVEWMPCPVDKVERVLPTAEALHLMEAYAGEMRQPASEWILESQSA